MKKPIIRHLKNGIPVILSPQKGAASMTVFVFCRVGSRYETKDINGASHFIEHLMFKGTRRRKDTQVLTRLLDQYGAEYNAMTSKDYTGYYVKIDASQTPLAVDLLHDMLFHSTYASKEINRERGVIIEEINMYEDNPRMHIEDLLEEALFPGSTLGWNIAGPREVIRTVPRRKLIEYRDAYYIPERLTVVIAGNVAENIMSLLDRTFGSVPRPVQRYDADYRPFQAPRALTSPLKIQEKNTEQVQIGMAFYGLPLHHSDVPAATLLATILGGTMSSRLFIQVRERRGLCYSIQAGHQPLEDTGIFSILSGLDKRRLPEAVKTIFDELKKIQRVPVSPKELRQAKQNIRGRVTLAFEESQFQADWYGKQLMFLNKIETPEERMTRIQNVTAGDIRRVARDIFRPHAMAASVIGPFRNTSALEKIFKME
ncbi:insulinase family protein [Patescibacteria group bacterium]|jgi:predicted Zn-dependent peptidase|uniref:Insulinase family protein n=1 Tax=candidate division WWE3 bacterium TaxID=2053526 RepID=A0A928Y4K6_UNCKA|nr:insulinase family protein [candidate division WWE3 bacterium]MCL4733058.1 insulinase family protein [Patescibacteria group bacterium]MDL1953313.1 insulinase family protein [Candidatus Uhrbacteria bacterium UHB]RIL00542.1 MAG: hypothetical protein DCC77_03220 [Candidatus Uhrbacteria bacterium]